MRTAAIACDLARGLAVQCGLMNAPRGEARLLKIRVRREDVARVNLAFPADAIERLELLMSDDLQQRITAQGIDLQQVVAEVRERGFTPGPVFSLSSIDKQVDVWLE